MANEDLMQNFNEENGNKLRKYLLIGGGLFVIFVIAIVASKFLFSSPKKEDTTVILPPDIKQNQNKDTNLFNDIPVENDNDFKKPITDDTQPANQIPANQIPAKPVNQQPINQQPAQKPQPQSNKTEQSQPTQQVTQTPQKTNQTTQQIAQKPQPKKPIVKEVKPAKKTKAAKKVVRNYYIQVAAVTKTDPSKRFLRLITKNGFKYKIVEVNVKGMKVKRVLVGPFSKDELKPALKKVKARISASAFVKRIK